jgi:hypothetical protein
MIEPRPWDELQTLYKISADDLREFKGRQWQVTNYALLLYGALAFIARETAIGNSASERASAVLVAISGLIVGLFAWRIVKTLQQAMELRRDRMKDARGHFSPAFRAAMRFEDTRGKEPEVGTFGFFIWGGLIALLFYLLRIIPC